MSVIIKTLMKSLMGKKTIILLAIFSIAVSASLLFANEGFRLTVESKFYESSQRHVGNSDITIKNLEYVGAAEWVDARRLDDYKEDFEYAFRFIREKALYTTTTEDMYYFTIIGANIDEFNQYNPITLKKGRMSDLGQNDIIIGETYAKKYGFKVSDTIPLELNGNKYDFTIAGISEAKGIFLSELADGGNIIASKEMISKIFKGDTNLMFIKLKDSKKIERTCNKIKKILPESLVELSVDENLVDSEALHYVLPFRISAIAVIFMSMFIIFTAFNLITMERIPMIGTLRSIGCTRKKIKWILVMESGCLGILGGFLGCVIGIGVLKFIKGIYFANDPVGAQTQMVFGAKGVFLAVGASVILTLAGSMLPIFKTTKLPIKNIILNDLEKASKRKSRMWIVGVIILIICGITPYFLGDSLKDMIIANTAATGVLFAMIMLIPSVTYLISKLIGKIHFISHEIELGVRNVRDNKNLINNIKLFASTIALIAFMSTIFNTMTADLLKSFNKNMKYDIQMGLRQSNKSEMSKLSKAEGVKSFEGYYQTYGDIMSYGVFLNMLYGIESEKFFEYFPVGQQDSSKEALKTLNDGKNIITTNILKSKLGLHIGDKMVIRTQNHQATYNITGFVETNTGIGHVGYISADNFKKDNEVQYYTYIVAKAHDDAVTLKNNIKRALSKNVLFISTKQEGLEANKQKVVPIFNSISTYTYTAMLVGFIGIMNNIIASFIERKRSFAMYRCVGMSKKGIKKMLSTEAVMIGVLGVGFGLMANMIMIPGIPTIVSSLWGKVSVALDINKIIILGSAGIFIMIAVAAIPVIKSRRISILQSLKYE